MALNLEKLRAVRGKKHIDTDTWNQLLDVIKFLDSKTVVGPSVTQIGNTTYIKKNKDVKRHPWQIVNYGINQTIIREGIWRRNGLECRPLIYPAFDMTDSSAANSESLYQQYTIVGSYGGGDYSTTQATDLRHNGMVYLVAALSTDLGNVFSNPTDWYGWESTQTANPCLNPTKVTILKYREDEKNQIFSGMPTMIDRCKRVIGAVRLNDSGELMECYQYENSNFSDSEEIKPWDALELITPTGTGTDFTFNMISGQLLRTQDAVEYRYTPSTTTSKYTMSYVPLILKDDSTNYVYAEYLPCGSDGTSGSNPLFDIWQTLDEAETYSNSTAFRVLLWTIQTSSGKAVNYKQHKQENINFFDYPSLISWNNGGNGKLEMHFAHTGTNGCGYVDIAQAVQCPT